MNLEDDSFLSDYLDDRLAPSERAKVESALASDPAVAESHRSLRRASRLVAGLSRPAVPVDLTSTVVIRAKHSPPRVNLRRVYLGSLWGAAAASILFAGLLAHYADLRPRVDSGPAPVLAHGPSSNSDDWASSETEGASFAPKILVADAPGSSAAIIPSRSEAAASVVAEAPEDRERLLALLDRADLHRVVVPIDALGADTLERVDEIVRTKTRKDSDYARFSLVQGLVVDPALPDKAELFVLIVDERERRELVASLSDSVPGVLAEERLDPAVPALLADAGRVRVLPGRSAAGLIDPPPLEGFAAHKVPADDPVDPLAPPPIRPRPRGMGTGLSAGPPAPVVDARPERRTTLVVWVTRPPSPD